MRVTALAPTIGCKAAAAIAKRGNANGTTLRGEALASGGINAEDYARLVDARAMTGIDRPR